MPTLASFIIPSLLQRNKKARNLLLKLIMRLV